MRKLLVFFVVLFAGCQQTPMLPGITPYRIDIQQGNVVTQDMVAKLKPGMSRRQVRFALGTPLVTDPFHADRWDYVYVLKKGGRIVEQRRIVVVFQDDKLQRIDGDVKPATTGEAAPQDASRGAETKAPATPVPGAATQPAR